MPENFSCDLYTSLTNVQHVANRHCYKITLEVPSEIGARIMEYAAMIGGLRPWEEAKLLDGGLRLTERGLSVPVEPCAYCDSSCEYGECDPPYLCRKHYDCKVCNTR